MMTETKPNSMGSGSTGLSTVWLVIFADLVALLLTFFVMLFSMSNVTVESWQKMVDALTDALNPESEEKIDTTPDVKTNIDLVFLVILTSPKGRIIDFSLIIESSSFNFLSSVGEINSV